MSLAVDDLLKNFEADPDAEVDLGDLRANTPREALETTVGFLENNCSPEDAERVHEALATTPSTE